MIKKINFKDQVTIHVIAGSGGNGCLSFRREKFIPRGGPDGGDGGRGGHVYAVADENCDSLLSLYYEPRQCAESGRPGSGKQQSGRNGADRYVHVPCGTEVREAATGDWRGEVVQPGDTLLLASGGRGGLGNCHFATATHQVPREFTPGVEGEERDLKLTMKVVADVGLVGYPNAGKSTLLSRLTNARPKIGPYPFTTINPHIGTLVFEDFVRLRIADIPGLIDGAHLGIGLGHEFLRHIERTRLLVVIIDMAGTDNRNPAEDYAHLRAELRLYREELDTRPMLVLANKMDVPEAAAHYRDFVQETGCTPLPISAETEQGLDAVRDALRRHFAAAPPVADSTPAAPPAAP